MVLWFCGVGGGDEDVFGFRLGERVKGYGTDKVEYGGGLTLLVVGGCPLAEAINCGDALYQLVSGGDCGYGCFGWVGVLGISLQGLRMWLW